MELDMLAEENRNTGAVFMDGSSIFFAVRDLYPGSTLQYDELIRLICREVRTAEFGPHQGTKGPTGIFPPSPNPFSADYPPQTPWIMWTSASSRNEGQARFLKHMHEIGWDVRSFSPGDSLLIDAGTAMSLSEGTRLGERMTRFDASIAYMIGRVAERCQVVVISDSFTLAEPLVRAARARYQREIRRADAEGTDVQQLGPNVLAYFGRGLDPRWFSVLKDWRSGGMSDCVRLLDLDNHLEQLMGARSAPMRSWLDDDIPDRRTQEQRVRERNIELEERARRLRSEQSKEK
jgi:hypothetical protein